METKKFDVIIVGGGSVGVGLMRDLALQGMSCLLLERGDFASQTSQTSSKMLHGGIRYLENCDFGLVWEALHEKNLWTKLAPHLAQDIPFYLPIYKESKYPLWMTSIGLKMYDLLSGFQNKPHSILNKQKTLNAIPGLRADGLSGSGVYFDAVVDDHKLILECLYDALLEKGTAAFNYMRVDKLKTDGTGRGGGDDVVTVEAEDTLTKKRHSFCGKHIIFATGPFTDDLLKSLTPDPKDWTSKLLLSKGAHLWLEQGSLPLKDAMVLQTSDKRLIFVIPQERGILVGTTETPVKEEMFDIKASDEDVSYLLKNINHYFPNAHIKEKQILSSFAGVRPLVRKGNVSANKASRTHKVYHHRPNVHVIIGGKYTTFRTMGQELAQKIATNLGYRYEAEKTLRPLRQKSQVINYQSGVLEDKKLLSQILQKEHPRTFEDLIYRRLNIPGKKHWKEEISFNDYFINLLPELQKDLHITKDDIIDLL